jgi:hypothetical protein
MSDIQGQLSLQAKLLQSIKDEIGGLKRAFAAAEASREQRVSSVLARLRSEFDMSRIEVVASNVLAVADTVERDSLRIQALMKHFGLPDIEFDGDGSEGEARP